MNKMKPLLLKPIPDYTIWGSDHLSKHRNYDRKYGTWWEVSAHPYCTNKITNLPEETTLQELIDQDMEGMLGKGYTLHEMLRLAYLDTEDALSIQVHPEDEYAKSIPMILVNMKAGISLMLNQVLHWLLEQMWMMPT